jgi:hypothetical protein
MKVFFVTSFLGGVGAVVGSILGNAFQGKGLYVGAVIGGMIAVASAVWLAARLTWFDRRNFRPALLGGEIGFLVAAPIAVQMLSSPIGPIASTALIGLGALVGSRVDKGGYENGANPQA